MVIFRCKICGGSLEVTEGAKVAECEYCGTKQTVAASADENLQNLFNRANTLRIKSEFDKAEKLYEKIIEADSTQAEAYWGLILCKYGIEYVDDPTTFRKIPTCHRTSFDSIVADEDYKSALANADVSQKLIYEEQAKEIDRIQKEILALAQKEENYDVFICYKETDADGRRTQDSVIANDIYYQLTNEGFKVFYAAITLEGKLGSAYEPIIFAALNSAKAMLVIGTKTEYFNAVWVKNEWSRYLKIIKNDRTKLLIPCYRDMDAYELPDEFAHLQAQDMSKIGFINDIVRGIKKVVVKEQAPVVKETVVQTEVVNTATNTAPLLKRAFMFLEDGEFDSADEYCERILDVDPENADAYLAKLLAEIKVNNKSLLKNAAYPFNESGNYKKAIRFGDAALKEELEGYVKYIIERNTLQTLYKKIWYILDTKYNQDKYKFDRSNKIYCEAHEKMRRASHSHEFSSAARAFNSIRGFKDADELEKECRERANQCRTLEEARLAEEQAKRDEIARKELAYRQAQEKREKTKKNLLCAGIAVVIIGIIAALVVPKRIGNIKKYNDAMALFNSGAYVEAYTAFKDLGGFKDSREMVAESKKRNTEITFEKIENYINTGMYSEAAELIVTMEGSEENTARVEACKQLLTETRFNDYIKLRENGELPFDKTTSISTWNNHTLGIKSDGTVIAAGSNENGRSDVGGYKDVVEVSAGYHHTVILKTDGTVDVIGSNGIFGPMNTDGWDYIVDIDAGAHHAVGLRSDGTVVAVANLYDSTNCNVGEWRDIVSVSAGYGHTVALKADGTVVAVGNDGLGQLNVDGWKDIVAIAVGDDHTVGLKSDGTVVAVGHNVEGQCNVGDWTDIVAISAGAYHTVGLKSDGTVVAVGFKNDGQCDVGDWSDIVAITAGERSTIGLRSDGTVVAVGDNEKGQLDISDWSDIRVP